MKAAADEALKIVETAKKENRDELSAEEQTSFDAARTKASELRGRIDKVEGVDEFVRELSRYGGEQKASVAEQHGTAGQIFVASENFKELAGRKFVGGMRPVEISAALLTPASGGSALVGEFRIPGVVPQLFQAPNVISLFPTLPVPGSSATHVEETVFTNGAAETDSEGATKAESTLQFDTVLEPIRTIATILPVANDMLADAPTLAAYIDARLRLAVSIREDSQVLNGDGSSVNLLGILNRSGLATQVDRGVSESYADAIGRQLFAIMAAQPGLMPDAIIINPTDWASIAMAKDANDRYYGSGPFQGTAPLTLFGVRVVLSERQPATTALVGNFSMGGVVYRRSGVEVALSQHHDTFFARNLTAVRAESRMGLGLYRPGVFGVVDLEP